MFGRMRPSSHVTNTLQSSGSFEYDLCLRRVLKGIPSVDLLLDDPLSSFLADDCQGDDLPAITKGIGLSIALSPNFGGSGGEVFNIVADGAEEELCRPLSIRGSSALSTATSIALSLQPVARKSPAVQSQRRGCKRQERQEHHVIPVKHRRLLSPEPCGPVPPCSVFSLHLDNDAAVVPPVNELVITRETVVAQLYLLGNGHQVNFSTEVRLSAPLIWRLSGKGHLVMILGLEEAPLRMDYSAIFPCRTVTTGYVRPIQCQPMYPGARGHVETRFTEVLIILRDSDGIVVDVRSMTGSFRPGDNIPEVKVWPASWAAELVCHIKWKGRTSFWLRAPSCFQKEAVDEVFQFVPPSHPSSMLCM